MQEYPVRIDETSPDINTKSYTSACHRRLYLLLVENRTSNWNSEKNASTLVQGNPLDLVNGQQDSIVSIHNSFFWDNCGEQLIDSEEIKTYVEHKVFPLQFKWHKKI